MFRKQLLPLLMPLVLFVLPAAAQSPSSAPAAPPARPRELLQLHMGGFTIEEALNQLDLTPQQHQRAQELLDNARRKMQELSPQERQELKSQRESLQKDIQAARLSGDRQALMAAQQKMHQFRQANRQRLGLTPQDLAGVLNVDQRAKLAYLMGPGGRFERLVSSVKQLKLTDDQRTKLDQIAERTRAAVRQRVQNRLQTLRQVAPPQARRPRSRKLRRPISGPWSRAFRM